MSQPQKTQLKQHLSDYLRSRLPFLLFFLYCCFFFGITFYLYRLPLKAVAYPALLCAGTTLTSFGFDFRRFARKRRHLQRLQQLPENLPEALAKYDLPDDRDYQTLIRLLLEEKYQRATLQENRISDMTDYYTTWVHQIKTPIASMRLTLQDEDSPLSRKLKEDLFHIEEYVEMVLCYLRLDASATDYVFREIALDELLRQSLRKYASSFISRGLTLNYEPTDLRVVTDEKWLAYVVEQVLSNALKYTPKGSISIFLEAPATLCIRDTGIGIAPEDLPRIFEKGYTGCNGRNDKKASGLGLYLCSRICKNLGHSIEASSLPGQGTTILLHLEQKGIFPE